MPDWAYHLQYLLPLYFGFAVGYDVYLSIYELVHHGIKPPTVWVEDSHQSGDLLSTGTLMAVNTTLWPNTTYIADL